MYIMPGDRLPILYCLGLRLSARGGPTAMATSVKLPTRRVGQTEVSAIGYGAMGISSYYGSAPPDPERFKVMSFSTDKIQIFQSCKLSFDSSSVA
jgi:hypothetical protein